MATKKTRERGREMTENQVPDQPVVLSDSEGAVFGGSVKFSV